MWHTEKVTLSSLDREKKVRHLEKQTGQPLLKTNCMGNNVGNWLHYYDSFSLWLIIR